MANTISRTMAKAAVVVAAAAAAACGDGASHSSTVGPAGGTVAAAGVKVTFPAGALSKEIQVELTELPRREGEPGRRVHVGPDDVSLSKPVSIVMHSDDGNAADEKLVEIEHAGEVEIEHGLETEHENEIEHGREVEVEHLGEFELRPMKPCDPPCGSGLECDDGVCKPHGGGSGV